MKKVLVGILGIFIGLLFSGGLLYAKKTDFEAVLDELNSEVVKAFDKGK